MQGAPDTELPYHAAPLRARSLVWVAIAASAIGVAVAVLVPRAGAAIPGSNLDVDFLKALAWSALLGASIVAWPVSWEDRRALLILWGVRTFVALVVALLYEWHYGGALDAFLYFGNANLPNAPLIPDAVRNSGGIAAILAVATATARIVPGSYHAIKVTFAMVGFIAVYVFYRAAVRFLGREDRRILYILGLFPSIVFWSSVLGKDPLQLLGLSLYCYGIVAWVRTSRWLYLFPAALGVAIAMAIRVWAGGIMLLPLGAFAFARGLGAPRRILIVALYAVATVVSIRRVSDALHVETSADALHLVSTFQHGWEGGSSIQDDDGPVPTDPVSLIKHAPVGVVTALFRPLPGEIRNVFGIMASVENLCLLVLLFAGFSRLRHEFVRDPLIAWIVLYVLVWAVAYGFATYNLGAMARFRLQILPPMVLLLVYVNSLPRREQRAAPGLA